MKSCCDKTFGKLLNTGSGIKSENIYKTWDIKKRFEITKI